MNLAYRKLAMLEKDFIEKEEAARIEGCISCPIDRDLQGRVTNLLKKVRCYTLL